MDLSDLLEFRLVSGDEIRLSGNDQSIPWDERNLIYQAAQILKLRHQGTGVEIIVDKKIPAGKGLGGGSGNAAMTLYALNKLWDLGLSGEELRRQARELGADVPFFLEGGFCLGEERGDVVTPLPDLPQLYCVLALPPVTISTAEVYGRLRLTSVDKESKITQFLALKEFGLLENRLEDAVFSLYPRLRTIKVFFRQREAVLSLVTGTGSAVFGLYLDKDKADKALTELKRTERALLVEALSRERYWKNATAGV